jgi:hypothetical protein
MILQIALSFMACFFYVVELYLGETSASILGELGLSVLFAIDYVLFFYCAQDRYVRFLGFKFLR